MPLEAKLLFSALALAVLGVLVFFVDRGDKAARDARFWKGGENDLFRRMIMKPNGQFRRQTKAFTVLWFVAWLAMVWMLA